MPNQPTIEKIQELAELSYKMGEIDDAYASERCRWVFDKKNIGQPMWWGVEQPYYKFLYLVAKEFGGGAAVEVGTHAGIGFSCLAAGAKANNDPKSTTIGMDMNGGLSGAREVATKYSNCTFLAGISTELVPQVEKICKENDVKIKIMFIDATHTISWVNAEVMAYKHLFDDYVIIIMDDCFRAANNTELPECFDGLPGDKMLFPGLHTDNCIGVAIATKSQFDVWHKDVAIENLRT